MEFGLMTEPQLGATYEQILDAARYAEKAGLEVFARSDHYLFPGYEAPHATDAFATLAGLARDTGRIRLCVLVSPITFRHPAVIAKMAMTIDEMSGGRLMLGLGTGWMEKEHAAFGLSFWDWSERFGRLEEALRYVRAAFDGRDGFTGDFYRLEPMDIRPRPSGALPLVVGGSGSEKTPRLAGTYADEYNLMAVPVGDIQARIATSREAAATAGRDPDRLRISVMGVAVVGRDEASYRANLHKAAASDLWGRSPDEIEARLERFGAPVGPAPKAREAMAALAAAGVDRFYLQHLGTLDVPLLDEAFEVLRG
ncbi:MAG: LLM class flavin-dependent oxidoreductase [Acidimicrobiia bacterium]